MGERDDRGLFVRIAAADVVGEAGMAEQPPQRKPADGDDQSRADELELPLAPERAELLLDRRRRAVAASGGRLARIAPRHGGAVERPVELVVVHAEPGAEGLAGSTAPGSPLGSLLHARRLPEHVGLLPVVRQRDRERFEWVARLCAGPADPVVALEGGERAVARAPPRHGERTTRK